MCPSCAVCPQFSARWGWGPGAEKARPRIQFAHFDAYTRTGQKRPSGQAAPPARATGIRPAIARSGIELLAQHRARDEWKSMESDAVTTLLTTCGPLT
jgi:hypothetical protein